MIKKILGKPTTTLSSLVNTLERFLSWLKLRNESWLRNKKFAYETYKSYRKDKEWHSLDADMLAVAIAYNEALLIVEDLVRDLKIALESNPYPGEQKRLVTVAVELFPDAAVRFEPGRRRRFVTKGNLWRRIFDIGKVSFSEKIYFPEVDVEWNITGVEERLLLLVREDNTILAKEVPRALGLRATSRTYAEVKEALQERRWVWVRRRAEVGRRETVVIPPRTG